MRDLSRFFLLTFALTWAAFFAAGRTEGAAASALILFGTFAPGLVAVGLTFRVGGANATHALLARLFQWRVPSRWYVFALTYMAAVKLLVAIAHRAIAGAWPRFGQEPWYAIVGATLLSLLVLGQSGEEVGWRGYALPRLATHFGLGGASVLLGLMWALWHLPLFFMPGIDKTGQSLPVYVLQVTALSVAMAWLYAHTNGSLLLAMLMHAAVNQSKDIVPSAVPGATHVLGLSTSLAAWLTLAFLWLAAATFLLLLSRREPTVP